MLEHYLTEILVSSALALFAVALRAWTNSLTKAVGDVADKVTKISTDLHAHMLDDARIWTRLDTDVKNIYRRLDRELPNNNKARGGSG